MLNWLWELLFVIHPLISQRNVPLVCHQLSDTKEVNFTRFFLFHNQISFSLMDVIGVWTFPLNNSQSDDSVYRLAVSSCENSQLLLKSFFSVCYLSQLYKNYYFSLLWCFSSSVLNLSISLKIIKSLKKNCITLLLQIYLNIFPKPSWELSRESNNNFSPTLIIIIHIVYVLSHTQCSFSLYDVVSHKNVATFSRMIVECICTDYMMMMKTTKRP